MPEDARRELRESVRRLSSVRSTKEALQVVETEAARLTHAVVPVLADHPLPLRDRTSGKAVAATVAGLAAGFAEIDEIAIIVTEGVAAPSAVGAFAGYLGAFVAELWVAVSVRVHQLHADDREVDPALLAEEVLAALLGTDLMSVRHLAGRVARAVGRRMTKRWAMGLVPVAGVAVDAWAASRTVQAISRLPLDAHPRAAFRAVSGSEYA
jgi:hypothetical protein